MIRLGAILLVLVSLTACNGSSGEDTTTTTGATTTTTGAATTTSTPVSSVPASNGLPEVWEDSACLQRYDPPRAAPPDGYVPHLRCEDDPTRIAPVARGFGNLREAIDAVLAGPTDEEAAVGFIGVGSVGGYDLSEGDEIIEIVLDGPTTPRLVAAVKATVEWGTTKEVTVR